MHADIEKILLSETQIAARITELACELNNLYKGEAVCIVGVLKGSTMFMMDLIRKLDMPVKFDFMIASSYGERTISAGCVNIYLDVRMDVTNEHVLLVEDIIDTGNTLSCLKEYFISKQAKSFNIITLLDKPERRVKPIKADYVGFKIPDQFVVGYGLDYAEKYRNLPYIGILKDSVWQDN